MNEDGTEVYAILTQEIVNSKCMMCVYVDPLDVQCMCKAFRCTCIT